MLNMFSQRYIVYVRDSVFSEKLNISSLLTGFGLERKIKIFRSTFRISYANEPLKISTYEAGIACNSTDPFAFV